MGPLVRNFPLASFCDHGPAAQRELTRHETGRERERERAEIKEWPSRAAHGKHSDQRLEVIALFSLLSGLVLFPLSPFDVSLTLLQSVSRRIDTWVQALGTRDMISHT